jgi:hypothetical protein
MFRPRAFVPAVPLIVVCVARSGLAAEDPRVATARRATGPIRLDGRLTEGDWDSTPPIGPLVQREPVEGRPPTESTDVHALFDEDSIYIGIV